MMKYLALLALMTFATTLTASLVVFEEPPAFIAYTFGAFTGAGWIGIIALWMRRCERG
ncbi:MAG: hypothetical protein IJ774_05795 [Selenomonadaceae bacterium]|nr:hypothetical protein [Selenomonadaceae bacterium]MBR1805888.1 hypothetical protein [Selenomonadaceae bacterium]